MTTKPSPPQPFNPWPWALTGFFIVLISCIASFITFAVKQDMQLVREDYYEAEVRYQQQIDRENRTRALRDQVRVAYDSKEQTLELQLPAQHAPRHVTGKIQFYRPSDSGLDHEVPVQLGGDGRQTLPASGMAGGLWNLHVFWEADGEEFYAKEVVIIPARKS